MRWFLALLLCFVTLDTGRWISHNYIWFSKTETCTFVMGKISFKKIAICAFVAIITIFLYSLLFPPSEEKNLGNGFRFFGDHDSEIYYWALRDTMTVFIPPDVLSYVNTKQFILARQKPHQFDDAIYPKFYKYPFGRDTTYYWFVDKQEKILTGPLLYSEMVSFLQDKDLLQMLQKLK